MCIYCNIYLSIYMYIVILCETHAIHINLCRVLNESQNT